MTRLRAEASAIARSWESALPRLEAGEVEDRRRCGPAAERLSAWGPQLQAALPRALRRWWPFGSSDKWMLRLRRRGPEGPEEEVDIDTFPLRIGRSEGCPMRLSHAAVSTEHAELRLEEGRALLMDLRSTNGTRRNGDLLTPLDLVPLQAGDRIDIGPFTLSVVGLAPAAEWSLRFEATPPRPCSARVAFSAASSADRWVRVRWAEETAFVRLSAPWIRACWRRLSDIEPEPGAEIDPMQEGAAQFVVHQVARNLAEELGLVVELSAWLTPAEARQASTTADEAWLASEASLVTPGVRLATSLLFPVAEVPAPRGLEAWSDLAWPVSLCLGLVRLTVGDWRRVEPGDALLPDVWWPEGWTSETEGDLGNAFLRLGRLWRSGRLLRSGADVKLRLDTRWLATPGGDWLMPDEDSLGADAESLPVQDLELQVAIELDRFPITLAELQRWRTGEVVSLRLGPADPVRLVVETGLHRRVLGEGRVVLVNGKLGIEILRVITRFEDGHREPGA